MAVTEKDIKREAKSHEELRKKYKIPKEDLRRLVNSAYTAGYWHGMGSDQ